MRRLLTNCSVVPCDGRPAIEDAAILIDDERIEAVDRQSTLAPLIREAGADLNVHDLGGRWVMPGLMDMHVHLSLALPGPSSLAAKLETDMALTIRPYPTPLDPLNAPLPFLPMFRPPPPAALNLTPPL